MKFERVVSPLDDEVVINKKESREFLILFLFLKEELFSPSEIIYWNYKSQHAKK